VNLSPPQPPAPARPAPATLDSAAPPVWARALAVYGVLLSAVLQANLPDIMQATGAPGSALMALAFVPLYLGAARIGLGPFRHGAVRALAVLVAVLTPSLLWSEHPLDSAIKFAAVGTVLAWAALLAAWPRLIDDALHAGLAYCAVGAAVAAAGAALPVLKAPSSSFALFVLFAAAIRWRAAPLGERVVVRVGRAAALAGLVGLVFASTFRAPTIGALLIVAFLAARSTEARAALVVIALAGGVFFTVESPRRAPSYTHDVARDDLVGRYETISEDRFSGRSDIWEGIREQAAEAPRWLFVGGGLGDVDFIVADANPQVMSFNGRGERVLSPHNQAIEIFVVAGIPGVLVLLWFIGVLAVRLGEHPVDAGLMLCTLVMSASNVPLIDTSGGGLCVALICVHFGQIEPFWRRSLNPVFAPGASA
jgi:hypothetical protein